MAWIKALGVSELPNDSRQVVNLDGQKVLLIHHKNELHATAHACPHMKLPLAKGKITDDCALECPFHHSAFDLKTGDVKEWSPWPPVLGKLLGKVSREKALTIYPSKIEDDHIWVDLTV